MKLSPLEQKMVAVYKDYYDQHRQLNAGRATARMSKSEYYVDSIVLGLDTQFILTNLLMGTHPL